MNPITNEPCQLFWERLYLLQAQSFLNYFSPGFPAQVYLLQEKHRFSVFQSSMYCFENISEPKGWGRGARSEGTFITFLKDCKVTGNKCFVVTRV